MCTFIEIESLAANALIELFERNHVTEVSFDMVVQYGMEIIRVLRRQTGEEAVLLLSQKYQMNMIENYSDFFDVDIDAAGRGVIRLKCDIATVKNYFRWTMSVRLLEAFVDPEALRKLGINV